MIDQPLSIGDLRWKVALATRIDRADPSSSFMIEDYARITDVYAKITPKIGEAIIGGEQIGTPITHEVIIRWQPYENVGMFDTIIRYVTLPNNERRAEVFRIRDVKEHDGRHRFLVIDAELEKYAA